MVPVIESALSATQSAPRVPARYTQALTEICPAAMKLGQKAAAAGWVVDPWYWVAADGTETSALVMRLDERRALATWDRKPGATWRTSGASGWLRGDRPHKLGVKRLTELLAT